MEKVVTKEQVKKIAKLSNLNLSSDEISKFSKIFTDILEYINALNELDLEDLSPTYQVTGRKNIYMVGKENTTTLSQKEALSNAKESRRGLFVTEGVFDRWICPI